MDRLLFDKILRPSPDWLPLPHTTFFPSSTKRGRLDSDSNSLSLKYQVEWRLSSDLLMGSVTAWVYDFWLSGPWSVDPILFMCRSWVGPTTSYHPEIPQSYSVYSIDVYRFVLSQVRLCLITRISPVAVNTGYVHCLIYPVNSSWPLFFDVDCNTASCLGHCALISFNTIESSCLTTVQGRRCGMMEPVVSADLLYSVRCYQSGVTLNVHLTYHSNNQIISDKNGQYSWLSLIRCRWCRLQLNESRNLVWLILLPVWWVSFKKVQGMVYPFWYDQIRPYWHFTVFKRTTDMCSMQATEQRVQLQPENY